MAVEGLAQAGRHPDVLEVFGVSAVDGHDLLAQMFKGVLQLGGRRGLSREVTLEGRGKLLMLGPAPGRPGLAHPGLDRNLVGWVGHDLPLQHVNDLVHEGDDVGLVLDRVQDGLAVRPPLHGGGDDPGLAVEQREATQDRGLDLRRQVQRPNFLLAGELDIFLVKIDVI